MQSPNVAGRGQAVPAGARSLLTARVCWTMDSPTEDAMASESTRMWCVAKSRVAMRDAPYVVGRQDDEALGSPSSVPSDPV